MISKVYTVMKRALWGVLARMILRLGILSSILSFADGWCIQRKANPMKAFPFVERRKHPNYQILLYHRVNDDRDPFFGGVPVKVFERQMEMLTNYFNVLPLEELMERVTKADVPPNAIAITFDGYYDCYENAFPVLRQFGIPATVFVVTAVLDYGTPLWHDHVFHAFRSTEAKSVIIQGRVHPLETLPQKQMALRAFLRTLRGFNPHDREMGVQKLNTDLGVVENNGLNEKMLNWNEVQEMSNENISFGAHTVTHPILTRMPLVNAVDEILNSRQTIEKRLMTPVRLFAYPNGDRDDFNESIKHVLQEAGFMCAMTTLWGNNDIHTDPFELRRVRAWDLDPHVSILRLGWYKFSL